MRVLKIKKKRKVPVIKLFLFIYVFDSKSIGFPINYTHNCISFRRSSVLDPYSTFQYASVVVNNVDQFTSEFSKPYSHFVFVILVVTGKTKRRVLTTVQFAKKCFGIFLDGSVKLLFELYNKSNTIKTTVRTLRNRIDIDFTDFRFA